MSFQIKYVYDLVDKLSPQLKKIQGNLKKTASTVSHSASKISQSGNKISSVFKRAARNVAVAGNKIGRSFDKIKIKMSSLGKSSKDLGQKMFLRMTLPIALLGGSFIKAASDYEESINKVDVAFGSASKNVKKFAKSAGKNFGIDRGAALDMAALFGDMGTGMGMAQGKAAILATSLVGLSGDLASFKNIRVDQATTALSSIFNGETESLKKLGVVMTETNLKEFALSKGITKKIKQMGQVEKIMLRYKFVMEMSKNSVGDFMRTQAGFANQTRILHSRFKDLSITLGTVLLPYATKLVNKLITMVEKFQALSPQTQKLILIFAALAAILPPLLISLGLMAIAVGAISAPMVIISAAILALVYIVKEGIKFFSSWNNVLEKTSWFLKNISTLGKEAWRSIRGFFGADIEGEDRLAQLQKIEAMTKRMKSASRMNNAPINPVENLFTNSSNINQNQSLTAGGKLDVNINGLPKGSSTQFTPVKQSFMDTGINTVYSGM
jgi:hypothetical protein